MEVVKMKNRTIRSAVYNQLGKNKVIRHIKPMIKHDGKMLLLLLFVTVAIMPNCVGLAKLGKPNKNGLSGFLLSAGTFDVETLS